MRNVSTAFSGAACSGATGAYAAVAYAAVLSLAACSSDATPYLEQPYTDPASVTPNGLESSEPALFSAGGDPDSRSDDAVDDPGVGVPGSEGAGQSPGTVPPASSEEPQPNATETNFFAAGCRVDADCGATRRCEFFPAEGVADAGPSDAGGASDTRPVAPPPAVPADAGPPDAGVPTGEAPDAPSEPLGPRGRCVARVAQ